MDENIHRTLEDYIFDMETRPPPDTSNPEDVWTLLQQKENDLLLAAELGKALLDKNEELKKNQDKMVENYQARLDVSNNITFFMCLLLYQRLNRTYVAKVW